MINVVLLHGDEEIFTSTTDIVVAAIDALPTNANNWKIAQVTCCSVVINCLVCKMAITSIFTARTSGSGSSSGLKLVSRCSTIEDFIGTLTSYSFPISVPVGHWNLFRSLIWVCPLGDGLKERCARVGPEELSEHRSPVQLERRLENRSVKFVSL